MENLTTYYYEHAGQPAGPVAADQLLASGVRATTQVWQEGLTEWVPAASIPALAPLFAPPALPPPLPHAQPARPVPASPPAMPTSAVPLATGQTPATPAPSRPQFSAEASKHRWWHYLILALAVLFLLLFARACGAIIGHAITATTQALPTQLTVAVVHALPVKDAGAAGIF